MARWLAIDPGAKRLGLAISDPAGQLASPLEVLPAQPRESMLARLRAIIDEYGLSGIVVGWPLNMDDSEGPQGQLARQFARDLADALGLDVRMWDERLTSSAADAKLAGLYTRKQKKARQDAVAAAMILQDFLSAGGPDAAPTPESLAGPESEGP